MSVAGLKILLVEDSLAHQLDLTVLLEQESGMKVVMATTTANDAIQWLEANPQGWDVALIDLFLAQGNGFHVLRRCRKVLPHQRAVVLSNYSPEFVPRYTEQAGADAFFDKSAGTEALLDYLRSTAASQR